MLQRLFEWLPILVGLAVVYWLFVLAVARFCALNERSAERQQVPTIADRFLAPRPTTVNGWGTRSEAEPFTGSDLRCWTPIPRRGAA